MLNLRQSSLLLIGFVVLFLGLTYLVQLRIETFNDKRQLVEEFMTLPQGEYLKPALLGYDQLMADYIWLRTIQVLGEKKVTSQGYDWIYHALDVVTTLDPKFDYAYKMGGVILSVLGNVPEKSNQLLLKGIRENPDVWQLPFYIGFNYFFYLNDYKNAAIYMSRASMLPGHPAYLPNLAARLYVQAGDSETALEFLDRMLHQTQDEKIRKTLKKRIEEIHEGKVKGIHERPRDPKSDQGL